MFALSLALGNRHPEKQQLKSGRTVCLSDGKLKMRQSGVVYGDPGSSHIVSLLCVGLYSQGHLMVRVAAPGQLQLSGLILGSKKEKDIKEEKRKKCTLYLGKIPGSCLIYPWSLAIGSHTATSNCWETQSLCLVEIRSFITLEGGEY